MPPSAPSGAALVLDGLSRLVLVAFVAVLPLFFLPFQWASIPQSKVLLAAAVSLAVALMWAAARLLEGTIHIPRNALFLSALLLPLAYAVSAAVAGFSGASIVGLGVEQDTLTAVIIWYAIFVLTALLFSGHASGIRTMLHALAIGLIALFALQALHIFLPAYFSFGPLQGATANGLGSWHDLGILASLGLFLSLVLWGSGIFSGAWRIVAAVLGALSLFVIGIVHFTDILWGAAALSAFVAAINTSAMMRADGTPFKEALKRSVVPVVLAAVLAAAAVGGVYVWDKLPAPLSITEIEVRPSWQGTFDVGTQSLGAPAALIFGTGPNSFIREWGRNKPEGVNATPFWNADFSYGVGTIPTSLFTAGVIGAIAWLAIMLVLLGYFFRFAREMRPLSGRHALIGVVLGSAIYLLVFHLIYTPGSALTNLMFVILGFLVVVSVDRPPREIGTQSIFGAAIFACIVLCAIPLSFASALVLREVASNLYVNRASLAYRADGSVATAGQHIQTALTISSRNDRAHRAASELGLVELSQLLQGGDTQSEAARTKLQQTVERTIQHGLTAVEIDDANYQNWLILAQVYGSLADVNVQGAYEQAQQTYERALAANPSNPVPKLRLAQLAAAQGNASAARGYLKEALALKQDFAAAYYLLSQIEANDKNGDAAIQAASAAVQIVPEDPLGWFNLGYILYINGSYQDAASVLEQAVARANDYSNAIFYLGASYYRLGRVADAIRALEAVLQLNPSETWIQEAIDRMREGKEPFPQG